MCSGGVLQFSWSEANPRTVICPSLRDLVPQLPEERDFALFGIFDGHGGKQVGDWGMKIAGDS